MITEDLEKRLDDFNPTARREALASLLKQAQAGAIALPQPGAAVNLHCHTFFSFNGYGYSPTRIAWESRKRGLYAAGIVDFDVLDAVDEFLDACALLDIKGTAGIETRVYIPQFHTREINSPGEPGIAYHMGVGFTTGVQTNAPLLMELKSTAQRRNREIASRVNAYLDPVTLDYERDVLPLTPKGNATERHLCAAYDAKAREIFPEPNKRARFWAEKLGTTVEHIENLSQEAPIFQGFVRSKLMKTGGAGYMKPDAATFPRLERFNRFVRDEGAIPTIAWLDGTTPGEEALDELLSLHIKAGAAALNIIPDRNWNIKDADIKKRKVAELDRIVTACRERGLPINVGTEMNAYGQRFVDDFDAPELRKHLDTFIEGANIVFAHTHIQRAAGIGYLSNWASERFDSVYAKNAFFAELGARLTPSKATALTGINPTSTPTEILTTI